MFTPARHLPRSGPRPIRGFLSWLATLSTLVLFATPALASDNLDEDEDKERTETRNAREELQLSSLAQAGRVLGGEIAVASSTAGLATHSLSLYNSQSLALTEHLAAAYHHDLARRVRSRHWIFPTLKEISGVVTREGVVVMDTEEKDARLLPTLSFSTVGAKVRINF